jgi:hypothetical protein
MNNQNFSVAVVCLFCGCELQGKSDVAYQSGDLIKCAQCGEENDYDSVIEIAQEKGVKKVKDDLEKKLSGLFKRK